MKNLSKEEKHAQCLKEIKWTALCVFICFAFHVGTAFALNGNGKMLFGMPQWFTVSVFGTIIIAIVEVIVLCKKVFIDFEYEDEESVNSVGGEN